MSALDDSVKSKISYFLPDFKKWLDTDEGRKELNARKNKENELKNHLGESAIDQLSELDFRQIVASLWAYAGWTNKDYVADRVLKNTDFNTLKSELKNLLYGTAPLPNRYDRFLRK